MEAVRPTLSDWEAKPAPLLGPVGTLTRIVAKPIANVVLLLGFSPGQLSLQSLWITILGFIRLMDGTFTHVVQGAGLAAIGLLLDRADQWVMEKKGRPSAWTLFLGIVVDRIVEIVLIAAAAWLATRQYNGATGHAVLVLAPGSITLLAVAAIGLQLAHRAAESVGDLLVLRAHLLTRQRLPAPVRLVRAPGVRPVLGRFLGRDEWMLGWAIGLALGEPAVVLGVGAAVGLVLLLEDLVLIHVRLRNTEARSILLLGPEYP